MAKAEKKKKRTVSLKWWIYGGFAVFSALALFLLFLFQVVLVDNTYRVIKQQDVEHAADSLLNEMNDLSDRKTVNITAQQHELCVQIIDLAALSHKGMEKLEPQELVSVHLMPECVLHRIPDEILYQYIRRAQVNGGTYIEKFDRADFYAAGQPMEEERESGSEGEPAEARAGEERPVSPNPRIKTPESLLYVRIGKLRSGLDVVLLINANVTPNESSVMTMRYQFVVLSIFFLVVGLAIALIVARFATSPIEKMNRQGRKLARGNYDADFPTSSYKEINQLGETLNFAAEELGKTDRLRKDLIANVSHDLRTPLTMISGYAEMMLDIPGENTEENIQVIADETRRLTTLVNNLLDVSKLESGTVKMNCTRYSISDSLNALAQRYSAMAAKNGYHVTAEIQPGLVVCADEMKIGQVVYNLMNNAMTYTGEDHRIGLRLFADGDRAVAEISDSGCGISKEDLAQIWDRYYRSTDEHKRAKVGSGLGLSIVKGIMQAHRGGSYGVRSSLGKGSTFWFSLPLVSPEEDR